MHVRRRMSRGDGILVAMSSERVTVLALDHRFPDLAPERSVLARVGVELVDGNRLEPVERERIMERVHGILLGPRFRLDRERIRRLRSCRIIVRYGIGVDNVDVEAAYERGILVSNVPNYCTEEVAIHTISLILALHRQLIPLNAAASKGEWSIPRGTRIRRFSQTCVGVLGFGRIGREVAQRLRSLGCRVLVHDPYASEMDIRAADVESSTFLELVANVDVLTLHIPLTVETRGIISEEIIWRMKRGAILINVSRGGLVDHRALYQALVSGHLGGAGLDVTDPEPPGPADPLLQLPNVIVTPHAAWFSDEAVRDLQRMAAEEAARVLTGQSQEWPVPPRRT